MLPTSSQLVTVEEDLPAAIPLHIPNDLTLKVSHEDFVKLAVANRDLRLERSAQGELIVNPPTGWETGERNMSITGELYLWWRNAGKPDKVFDSSTGFYLPNGADRSPDASWVSQSRWDALQKQHLFSQQWHPTPAHQHWSSSQRKHRHRAQACGDGSVPQLSPWLSQSAI